MLKKVLFWGLGFSCLLAPSALQAQISVDAKANSAHRPDIVAAPNGVPSIDIVTPNSSGLSHNKYDDFNIGHVGVIWNNHAQEVGQSQLGGIMPGNPHLRFSGSAKIILNEVTSGKRSALNGPGEVFGKQADVIIANPNGISCDGCGFINTPHATLTTGVPEIDVSGFLKGFVVKGGEITFGARGANFFSGKGVVDVVDIVSRTVHFEGPVAGREIGVAAGTGNFDYASRQMKALTDITGKPEYAIDGSALGALQADQIKLVATEKGVGVRMRHDMAANAGQLHLSADGKISLQNAFGHRGVVLKSKSQSVLAKHIASKKHIEIAAKKDVTLETIGADGHFIAEAQEGLLTIAGQATSGGNMQLSSREAIKVSGLGAGADIAFATGGDLTIGGTILSGGNLKAHAGGDIRAHLLAGGVDMAATGAAGKLVLGSHGGVDLQSVGGVIAAESIYGAGEITLVSHNGVSVSQFLQSHDNVAIHTQPDAGVHFGQLIAYGRADIDGGAVDFSSLMTGEDAVLKVRNLEAGTLMTGGDFVQSSVFGKLILHEKGSLSIRAQRGIKVGHIISGENIALFAGNDIYYDQVIGYGSTTLTSGSGGISVENVLSAMGDVRLTANTLDLSKNCSHIYTPQTLYLKGDHIDVSGSELTYGGLDFQSTNALDIQHARLQSVTDKGGSGDIIFRAPGIMTDKETSVLAARDFTIKTGKLHNSGQLAAGQNLAFSVTGDATNSKTGLIYVKGNGALKVDGALLNDLGAIVAEGDLSFTNLGGTGKSLSLVNKAGLIQAGGNLSIQTKTLQNEADSIPEMKEKKEYSDLSFQRPDNYDLLYKEGLLNKITSNRWSKGYIDTPFLEHREFILEKELWDSKEKTYGKITLNSGIVYKAFTWQIAAENGKDRTQTYIWNDQSYMTEKTVTQAFSYKPAVQGMIQSTGDLIIHADNIENHYSIMRAGGNADIYASVLTNVGATAYKNTYLSCKAGTDNCYAYNSDGSRDVSLDIANGTFRQTGSEVLDTVSGLVQAGGTLNLVVNTLNNTAAEGSITGGAHFGAKAIGGNPLDILNGLTGAGSLFSQKVDINGAGELSEGSALPLSKPQLDSVGDILPKQNFLYKTRAEFLDVGKFYGSAYFLNRIGYNPDREIFFLGDAYFEKQLVEEQLRDLVGQGLGKGGVLIPGKDAVEQMKTLLDVGADYVKANNLPFGEALSEQKLASLETPMVIYVRQSVKGMDVYAPVLYIPEKDRASFVFASALIMGENVNITAKNITNSGRINATHHLQMKSSQLLGQGGHFVAGNDAVLLADNNICFESGRTSVEGVETVLNTHALSVGGNAAVIAKQDVIASGVRITTGRALVLSAVEGILSIVSAANTNSMGQNIFVIQHQSEVHSGGSITFSAAKDLNVAGSRVQAHDNLYLKTERNVSIDATYNSINHYTHGQTSRFMLHKCSHLSAGKGMAITSGRDIRVSASDMEAKGNIALGAQGAINVIAKADKVEYHLQSKGTQIDRHVSVSVGASIKGEGDFIAFAGQDGKPHNLSILGSSITVDGKVGMKASNDILITNIENSLRIKISGHTKGGFFGSDKSVHNNIEVSDVMGSNISGGEGVALESGKNIQIVESTLLANIAHETKDQVKANIFLKSGDNIIIKGAEEKFNQQQQWIKKAFLNKKRSHKSDVHKTPISSTFEAEGDIVIESQGNIVISGSQLFTKKGVSVIGESVSIDGMSEHHNSHSQEHESGFGVGSTSNFMFIGGKESKTKSDEIIEYKGSSLNADGNIKIAAKKSNVHVMGSDLTAREELHLSASHNVNVKDGRNNHSSNSQEKRFGLAIQLTKKHNDPTLGIVYAKDKKNQGENSTVQSHLMGGRDVQISADHDVRVQAADVLAEHDVNIHAGHDVKISESHDVSKADEMHQKSFANVKTSFDVGTVENVNDATKCFTNGDRKHKVSNSIVAEKKTYDLDNKGKDSYNGVKGGATKDALLQGADVSTSITAVFNSKKAEASSHTSTAVTDTIKAGRAVNMQADKGSIYGIGADIIAGSNPVYQLSNNEQSENITLKAGQDIKLESAQNTKKTQRNSQNSSVSVGYNFSSNDSGWIGNASVRKGKGSSDEVKQKNSHVVSTSDVQISSGANTALEGAVISGKHAKMDVGSDLTIASRSDREQISSKQQSLSIGYNGEEKTDAATNNMSFQKNKSSSDYKSVVEQSGIKADEQGFEITVKDKTTLTDGIIESSALAEKNSLTTGTITTSDIVNNAKAQASSQGLSLATGGPMYQGKYGLAKNIAKNVLDHAKEQDSAEGQTKAAISNGTIILTDEVGQKALTGQDVEQTIASLNRDTATAHHAVSKIDIEKLERIVHENREMATQLLEEGFKYSDEAYKTMFIKEHPIAVVERDEKGNIIYLKDENGNLIRDSRGQKIPKSHSLTAEEKEHLQAGSDGKVHVSFNGIFTPPEEAAVYAEQHAVNKNEPLYFVVFPQADTALSELLVAGYQKLLENNFWGLTNSTQEAKDLMSRYGNTGLHIDAHSRGSMTGFNALNSFKQQGVHGVAKNTNIKFFGPAANASATAGLLGYASDGKQTTIELENHADDFVGIMIGGNPATFYKRPPGSNAWKEAWKMFLSYPNVHACYGHADLACQNDYGLPHSIQIPSSKSWSKK
ncbi:hemagglutinin repeat-containing protein [Bartonella henselae]|nr:hemagglutinin repeat-containing protein [Bartonella henselae]